MSLRTRGKIPHSGIKVEVMKMDPSTLLLIRIFNLLNSLGFIFYSRALAAFSIQSLSPLATSVARRVTSIAQNVDLGIQFNPFPANNAQKGSELLHTAAYLGDIPLDKIENNRITKPRSYSMKRTLAFLIVTLMAHFAGAENYCLAIRGNGELAPAHWGGMSRIVETLGLPAKQAGGSSASISMFFMDAIATNSLVQKESLEEQKVVASLLIKSLQGYLLYLSQTQEFKDVQLLLQQSKNIASTQFGLELDQVLEILNSKTSTASLVKAKSLIEKAFKMGIINQKLYSQLVESANILITNTPSSQSLYHSKRLTFILSELQKTLSVFGKFNAESDVNLFFRPGIINFEGLANQLGRIANFYSQNNSAPASLGHMRSFVASCKEPARNSTWAELLVKRPDCQTQLMTAINAYFVQEAQNLNFASHQVGKTIESYPTTSVLVGRAYTQAKAALSDYEKNMDPDFGNSFVVKNPEDVRFGYWGKNASSLKSFLPQDDEKSARFYSLGQTTWRTALSLSPAEPGLSPIIEFTANNNSVISAGGWSDLHPVLVLKAAGCENVVYLNRRGGESLFAQGVAKRLFNFERSWDVLKTQSSTPLDPPDIGAKNGLLNNLGDPSDMTSLWSRLFNMANPNSSYNRALKEVDAVLCTDWNDFDSFKKDDVNVMIQNAYTSSFYVNSRSPLYKRNDLIPRLNPSEQNPAGYPANIGCHP